MPEVMESGVVNASADRAWAVLRDFASPKNFSQDIVSSDVEDDFPVDQVGVVRRMVFRDGGQLRERLVALSDRERYLRYTLLPPETIPIRNYSGKISVRAITDCDQALIEWTGSFSVPEGNPEEVREWVREGYRHGIKGMRAYIEQHA